jgi:hypothetical protein
MTRDEITHRHRAGGPRHILYMAPMLAILLAVGFSGCSQPPPKEIKDLEGLGWSVQQLTDLITLEKADCTNADLATLAGYAQKLNEQKKRLTIVISGSQVTDAGLANIKSLDNVSTLNVSKTGVGGTGLAEIAGWTKLTSLDLSETKVDDDALAHLSKLTNLNSLTLDGCSLSGVGLGNLKDLAELQSLRLDKTKVDDAGLAKLPPLPKLKNLRLNDTQITDTSIEHLKKFPALQELWVKNVAGITDGAVEKWEEANEDLVIER